MFADFHNADEHGRLRLDGPPTREDLARMETFTDEVMRGLLAQSLGTNDPAHACHALQQIVLHAPERTRFPDLNSFGASGGR